jgi:long-subunit fatty acid transport protein
MQEMHHCRLIRTNRRFYQQLVKPTLLSCLLLFPATLYASFIESSIGASVVNDATATYYNPAALTVVKNAQFITLGSLSYARSRFSGQAQQSITGYTQSGSSSSQTNYFLPSLYFGIPVTSKISVGMAIISNFFDVEAEDISILRYAQASNNVKDIDLVPALGIKLTDYLAIGAGVNFSHANFIMQPISGSPALNIPDSKSRNECSATGVGGDAGLLLALSKATIIGFNYRSAITYGLSGKSILQISPELVSNQYGFHFWTPARSVLSINHFVTPVLGFIGTIQRIQWSIFDTINVHGIATQVGSRAVILNAAVPYHMHNTWLLTLGTHYRITPGWILRVAGSYNQAPGNNSYQITNGNAVILGASMGYEIHKRIIIDGSYAHAFLQNEDINIMSGSNRIKGVNQGAVNAFSLKLTLNI